MNARIAAPPPKAVHAEHTVLMRDRNPWDVPMRLLHDAPLDLFQDISAEEHVLSFMLTNPGRVRSLDPDDFTGRDRPVIYVALRDGYEQSVLDKLDQRLDMPGYLTDLLLMPSQAASMREHVEQVKRLAELRRLNERVVAWQKRAPTMSVRRARAELAKVWKEAK